MTPTATFSVGYIAGMFGMFSIVHIVAGGLRNRKVAIGAGLFSLIGVIGAVWGNW